MKKLNNKKVYLALLVFFVLGLSGYAIKALSSEHGLEPPGVNDPQKPLIETTVDDESATQAPDSVTATVDSSEKGAEVKKNGEARPENTGGPSTSPSNAGGLSSTIPSNTGGLSNAKNGWGLKRNDSHLQPEMSSSTIKRLGQHGAYWIGKSDEKVIYLTFDEGYENGYTPVILDSLKANDVKAAFFVTGHYLKTQPDLVRRMVEEGHIVGNHTDTHPSLPDISDEEIKKELQVVEESYESVSGKKGMKYLRPPKGEYSERTLALTRELGYHNIFWSMAFVDWVPMPGGPDEAYRSVMDNLHNGALVLLHAVSKDNTEAMDRILKDIKARGYSFKTLDDLVRN